MAITDKGLKKGTVLDSGTRRYTVIRTLGAGGFGITYLVQGKVGNISTFFAVKEHFISSKCERDDTQRVCYSKPVAVEVENSLKDFITEANRLNKESVRHHNIVGINEVFKANNTAYYVMEYISGPNLRDSIEKNRGGRPYSEKEALDIIAPVLDAMALMHSANITHLDIKPDNILLADDPLTRDIRPVIIDFGVSKHYDEAGNATSTINIVACSNGYSPIEQYMGITTFTPQADVYALGATLYFLLTGENPPKADAVTPEQLNARLAPLASPKTVAAIVHAMSPSKLDRTKSIVDFRHELGLDAAPAPAQEQAQGGTETVVIEKKPEPKKSEKKSEPKKPEKKSDVPPAPVYGTPEGWDKPSSPAGQPRSNGSGGGSKMKWKYIAGAAAVLVVIIILISLLSGEDAPVTPEPDTNTAVVDTVTENTEDTASVAPVSPTEETSGTQPTPADKETEKVEPKPDARTDQQKSATTVKPEPPKPAPAAKESSNPMSALQARADAGDKDAALKVAQYYLTRNGGTASDIRMAAKYAKKAGPQGQSILKTAKDLGLPDD